MPIPETNFDKLLDLFRTSVVAQAIAMLVVLGVSGAILIMGGTVPEWWQGLTILILGFYFGGKVAQWQLNAEQVRAQLIAQVAQQNGGTLPENWRFPDGPNK